MRVPVVALAATLLVASSAAAQQSTQAGPIIESGGAVFRVSPTFETPMDLEYKVAYEVSSAASQPDRVNQSFNTPARFLNMHAQAGIPADKVHVAVVVHGGAVFELLDDEAYRERNGVANPNTALLRELIDNGTPVIVCGQSAASRRLPLDHLIPGVQVALSAMTAFVVLQERGYRVNPW